METLKDKNGSISIHEGMPLVNRYLNNGLLEFIYNGYIPPRDTYFNSLKSNNFNN